MTPPQGHSTEPARLCALAGVAAPGGAFYVDGFLADAALAREDGLRADFLDWPGPDGQVYKRVCLAEVPGLRDGLERFFDDVEILGQGYRLNYAGELPNQAVHADIGWGRWAAVLYLADGPGGTAFWRHRDTGACAIHEGEFELLERISGDFEHPNAWEQTGLVEMAFNRCALYDSRLFHSRWPFEAFGSGPSDGRLVAVAFFNGEIKS